MQMVARLLEDSVCPEYHRQFTAVYHCRAILENFIHVINKIRVWTVSIDGPSVPSTALNSDPDKSVSRKKNVQDPTLRAI
jgi:hypothetical protein